MTTWFVTRHVGAALWGAASRIKERYGNAKVLLDNGRRSDTSLDISQVKEGDAVIGTLPIHIAAEVCARGGRYIHISLDLPTEARGRELTPAEMDQYGARLEEFVVAPKRDTVETIPPAPPPNGVIHVCIVSDQYLANLLPALKRRPEKIVLVATGEMNRNKALERITAALGRFEFDSGNVEVISCPDECSTDSPQARSFARELRAELREKFKGKSLTLNATGGTKPLSRAFTLEFADCEQIYTDTRDGQLRFLSDVPTPPEALGNQITKIEDYLWCQNYSVVSCDSDAATWVNDTAAREQLTKLLAQSVVGFYGAEIGVLLGAISNSAAEIEKIASSRNATMDDAFFTSGVSALLKWHHNSDAQKVLLDAYQGNGLITLNSDYISFPSLSAFRYMKGGWIEEYAYLAAKSLNIPEMDIKAGLYIVASRDPDVVTAARDDVRNSDNELDLILLYRNQVLIAECKTISWGNPRGEQQAIMNKLDALGSHARGLFGKSLLVSARGTNKTAKRRADMYQIRVIEGATLMNLRDEIAEWAGVSPRTTWTFPSPIDINAPRKNAPRHAPVKKTGGGQRRHYGNARPQRKGALPVETPGKPQPSPIDSTDEPTALAEALKRAAENKNPAS